MAKTKVLRIISRLNIGGVSIHCTMLSKHLPQDKYECLPKIDWEKNYQLFEMKK